jgi:hypothetical protein
VAGLFQNRPGFETVPFPGNQAFVRSSPILKCRAVAKRRFFCNAKVLFVSHYPLTEGRFPVYNI